MASRQPLFSWLTGWQREQLHGRLVDIFISPAAAQPLLRVPQVECVSGSGLRGDRYADGRGHWIKTDGCEVTLVSQQELLLASRRSSVALADGQHRRNLVIDGIPLAALRNRTLRIGDVTFAYHRLRPPCAYLDRVQRAGTARALRRAGGVGLRVLSDGVIRVGDPVEVLASQKT